MTDRAAQIAALLKETYMHCGGSGERAGIFAAVAAVLAHQFDRQDARLDALEARGKAGKELKTGSFAECFEQVRAAGGDAAAAPAPAHNRQILLGLNYFLDRVVADSAESIPLGHVYTDRDGAVYLRLADGAVFLGDGVKAGRNAMLNYPPYTDHGTIQIMTKAAERPEVSDRAVPPVPQPGATRGAEVAEELWRNRDSLSIAAVSDRERAAARARAQALEEAELKVLDHLDNAGPGCRITLRAAAAAVARLREGT
jgi:hypothetical protein